MQALRTLMLILIAATFAVGGTARAMPMPASEPPCHEAPASPEQKPAQPAINCCIGCVPAPGDAVMILSVAAAEPTAYSVVHPAIEGRLTAPDPHPPRPDV